MIKARTKINNNTDHNIVKAGGLASAKNRLSLSLSSRLSRRSLARMHLGSEKYSLAAAGGMAAFTLVAGAILVASSNVSAVEETTTAKASVTVAEVCTLNSTVDSAHTATISPGTYVGLGTAGGANGIGQTTLKVTCNDSEGFSIYAVGYTGDTIGTTTLVGTKDDTSGGSSTGTKRTIVTGTATSGDTSNWAMQVNAVSGTYAPTIENSFDASSYHAVPDKYTKIASRTSNTDIGTGAIGSSVTTTYGAYIGSNEIADTYTGKVKYTLVHPASETPLQPQPSTAGYINYYANAGTAVGSMGRQAATDGNTVQLFASNFSRDGYGFAGWSDAYDYATNTNAHFYGPNEDITVPTGTTANGLSLYAVWVKSAGSMQQNAASICNSLTPTTYSNNGDDDESTWFITASLKNSITALTDDRDGDTYAIARLSDDKCWMIENLRLADSHQEGTSSVPTTLTTTNTNDPLNDGTKVTLKHNYADTDTFTNLSATSSDATSWCTTNSAACDDQSRLRTDNTSNRASYSTTQNMSTDANLYSYGNYYNWYSATAGRGTYSTSSNVTTTGDLCPYGWHLPTGTGSGEFGLLSNSLGGYKNASNVAQQMTSSTSPTNTIMSQRLRNFPNNFVYSGYVPGAWLNGRGTTGGFWSSTASSRSYTYYLSFNNSYVVPGAVGSYYKYNGAAVRCVVAPGA